MAGGDEKTELQRLLQTYLDFFGQTNWSSHCVATPVAAIQHSSIFLSVPWQKKPRGALTTFFQLGDAHNEHRETLWLIRAQQCLRGDWKWVIFPTTTRKHVFSPPSTASWLQIHDRTMQLLLPPVSVLGHECRINTEAPQRKLSVSASPFQTERAQQQVRKVATCARHISRETEGKPRWTRPRRGRSR